MRICRTAHSVHQREGYFSIETNAVPLRIWFVTDSIVRIRAGFDGSFDEESYSLVTTAWPDRLDDFYGDKRTRITPATAQLEETETQFILTGSELKVVVDKKPFRIHVYDSEGTMLHSDIVDLCYMEDSNHRRIHTSEISPEDLFFGFGEKSGRMNKAQCLLTMSPKDAMGYDPEKTDSLYKHIPFYIKLNASHKKAVGYFYHNTYECDFDMGREKSNYWKPHSRYRTDGGDVDLFLIAGPQIRQVVQRYTDLTGKSAMLPRYALGYLGSSMYYPELPQDCDDAIVEFIDTTHEENMPVDGFQLSSGYCAIETEQGIKRCVFTWNKKRFKNPHQFFADMEERGVSVSPNVKPGLLLVHPMLEELKKEGIFVKSSEDDTPGEGTWWGGTGIFVDFTNPHARKVWKELLKEHVLQYGTSSIWNDNCEYDSMVDKDCRCDFEGKGGTIGQLKAIMSNIMCHLAEEAIREVHPTQRPYVVCRSGHSGIQRYAQTWAGDNRTCWESLRYNIATILGMSLSGVANQGCDIGGFFGPSPDAELLVRWVQNGIFQPRFSIHSTNTDNTVTEPWMYSQYKDTIRRAMQLRYQLSPYLYSLVRRAHEQGLPIMEPLCSAFQQDTRCYEQDVEFMLGDSLLVANVVEQGATHRTLYLPDDGMFYDFETRTPYQGGTTITLPVTMDSIPMFLREGSILPMAANPVQNLHKDSCKDLHLICVTGRDNEFVLYEDDGLSNEYEQGMYHKTTISIQCGEHTELTFRGAGDYPTQIQSVFVDMVHREKAPFWVALNGRILPHFLHRKKFEAAETGWYYSQRLKSVQIKYPMPVDDCHTVTVSFEEFDMIGM